MKFKLSGDAARNAIGGMIHWAPWYAKPGVQEIAERLTPLGISVEIKHNKPKHTTEQQHYYHFGIDILAKSLGMSHAEAHENVLIEAFGGEVKNFMGREITIPKQRSAKLEREVYSQLIETLMRVASWAGVVIPEPEEI